MKSYHIPNTDLEVSRLAYGTWHMGGSWDHLPVTDDLKARAELLIRTAAENGITHIDLADIYTFGKSDQVVGYALAQNPGLRDKLVLQAKAGIIIGENGDPGRYDFSYEHIVSAVEGTLQRLGTDHVELLALHRPDPLVEYDEIARAVDHLHSSGKVLHIGVSNHNVAQMALLQKHLDQPIVVNQLELNLLHHHLISDGFLTNMTAATYAATHSTLEYCRMQEIMIQAWSPIAGGELFTAGEQSAENVRNTAQLLREMAAEHDTTPDAIAFAWLLRHPMGIQPIIGTLKAERIVRAVAADDVELSRIEWYKLLQAARGAGVP
jgi:predicted oxidoreductase